MSSRRYIVTNLDRDGRYCGVPTPPLTEHEVASLAERRTGREAHDIDLALSRLSVHVRTVVLAAKDGHQYNPVRVEIA